jgi:hypothetical protein
MSSKVTFTLEPSVHIYKKRKPHVSAKENDYESEDYSGAQTGRVHAPAEAVAEQRPSAPINLPLSSPKPSPPPPLNLFSHPLPPAPLNLSRAESQNYSYDLKITVPTPGAYRAPSTSPPASLSPRTRAELVREAREGLEREKALRKVEEAIRQAAIGLAHNTFLRTDTPLDHLTPHSERTPASVKSLRSPRMGLHLSPLQLSPLVQSPKVADPDQGHSLRPRVMLRPIAEKNGLSSLSLDSLNISNEGSFISLNTMA